MPNITAAEIAALRQATGAGILDSRKALVENDGDFEKAKQWLREQGLAGASKRGDRDRSEGAVSVVVTDKGRLGAVVALECETDFVAKSADFVRLVDSLAEAYANDSESGIAKYDDEVDQLKVTLKENIAVGRKERFEAASDAVLDSYLHIQNGRGVNGVLVELAAGTSELAHDIAVHIAFARPEFLRREDIPQSAIDQEKSTIAAIARNENKPEAQLEKIVEGRLNGWFKERVLYEQSYARDEKKTIAQLLESAKVTRFAQVVVGGYGNAPYVSDAVTALAGKAKEPRFQRAVLKLSGEALASSSSVEAIDGQVVRRIAREIAETTSEFGVELALMVGGGNIWRGQTGVGEGMDRATSDTMGMLGTVINALALQDAIEREGQQTRVMSGLQMREVCEPYIRRRAIRHLEKGRVVIFAAGMGKPFFTTDTPAALRAAEIEAEVILKGTHSGVDGVYSADPLVDPTAVRFDEISFRDVIARDLRIIDLTAITFCKDNGIPILVFDLMTPGNIRGALDGAPIGTLIR